MSRFFQDTKASSKGFLDLVSIMMKMMEANASKNDVCDFIYEAGLRLSEEYPVHVTDSLSRLNLEMNDILENLGFGVVTLSDEGDNLKINLRQLPECTDKDYADNFLELFSVLLCGLYKGWFEQTGAPNALKCVVVSLKPQEVVLALKAQENRQTIIWCRLNNVTQHG